MCEIDVFTKHACVEPLKDKNHKIVVHDFIETVNESKHKPKKVFIAKMFTL